MRRGMPLLILALLAGCQSREAPPPPTLDDAASATYTGIYENPVTLKHGVYEGEPFVADGAARPRLALINGVHLTGDLDGDGADEAVVLLAESSGGSGVFTWIAALARRHGRVVDEGTARVGDRVQIRSMRIDGGVVLMDVVEAGPDDPMCCPTQEATRRWRLSDDGLTELMPDTTGVLSLADIAGVTWRLSHLGWNEPVPQTVDVTLSLADSTVSGRSGCNRYHAGITESSPGTVSLSGIVTTRMACPDSAMAVESRYLQILGGLTRYSFFIGHLALSCQVDNRVITMLYEPSTEREP